MDDIRQATIDRFRAYLERRQFSAHTLASYTLDLHVFFTTVTVPLPQVSFREVDHFVEHQHQQGRAWATINRRLNALKHFFDFCLEQQVVANTVRHKSCLEAPDRFQQEFPGFLRGRKKAMWPLYQGGNQKMCSWRPPKRSQDRRAACPKPLFWRTKHAQNARAKFVPDTIGGHPR